MKILRRHIRPYRLLLLSLLLGLAHCLDAQTVRRYVDASKASGGNGTSWATAYNSVQTAIDVVYAEIQSGTGTGEVWVKTGTYSPTTLIAEGDTKNASFIIREGVQLYGGFAGTETSIADRPKSTETSYRNYGWAFANQSVLTGDLSTAAHFTYNPEKYEYTTQFVNNVYHVVWFATKGFDTTTNAANALSKETIVDGFVIMHGNAANTSVGYHTSRGGGVYLVDGGVLRNCLVRQNRSTESGAGVFADNGGVIEDCAIAENQCEGINIEYGFGGGVTLYNKGVLKNSLMINNVARNGGGVALYHENNAAGAVGINATAMMANCMVSNNNALNEGGGIYMHRGGAANQITIVRNYCAGEGLMQASIRNGRTGGVYINHFGTLINSVCWSNDAATQSVQYHLNRTGVSNAAATVQNCALSSADLINWEGTANEEITSLSELNTGASSEYYPVFLKVHSGTPGVCEATTKADDPVLFYFTNHDWKPDGNSSLREKGTAFSVAQTLVPVDACVQRDVIGDSYKLKSDIGAFRADNIIVTPTNNNIYVDPQFANVSNPAGNSWDNPISSLNDALIYCNDNPLSGNNSYTIHVKEGILYTYGQYINENIRSSCIRIPSNVTILGGYNSENPTLRNPVLYPTLISGDIGIEDTYSDNSYHCFVTKEGATNVVIDGLHIVFGNASTGTPHHAYGGGLLVTPSSAVTLRNSIIENCTAPQGSAIYVHTGASLTMSNCVINNNTTTGNSNPSAIYFASDANVGGSSIIGSTVLKNVGIGVYNASATNLILNNSCIWNNRKTAADNENTLPASSDIYYLSGNLTVSHCALDNGSTINGTNNNTTLTYDRVNNSNYTYPFFVNGTRQIGANQTGFNTYYGGYADWTPENMNPLVNAGSLTGTDMVGNARTTGGASDIGALQNVNLPESGEVIYVRTPVDGGNDSNNGLSWATAKATIGAAQNVSGVKEIWVAAGTYQGNFTLTLGIDVYGGFLAVGNPGKNSAERDISHKLDAHKTVLQGYGNKPTSASGSRTDRVLNQTTTNSTTTTTWEGFVIEKGLVYRGLSSSNPGGAGVILRQGGRLKNCLVQNCIMVSNNNTWQSYGGAGVYCNGGLIENCIIKNNFLAAHKTDPYGWLQRVDNITHLSAAGLYTSGGKIVNCIIVENESGTDRAVDAAKTYGHNGFSQDGLTNVLGAGVICGATSYFYNCTIAYNIGRGSVAVVGGVWDDARSSIMINSILWGNVGYSKTKENFFQFGVSGQEANSNLLYSYMSVANYRVGSGSYMNNIDSKAASTNYLPINCYELLFNNSDDLNISTSGYNYGSSNTFLSKCLLNQPFDGYISIQNDASTSTILTFTYDGDYELKDNAHKCINTGYQGAIEGAATVKVPKYTLAGVSNGTVDLTNTPNIDVDAAGYERTKNCTVDKGAYEYDGKISIVGDNEEEDEVTYYTYFVTQNGSGVASGANKENAACATLLQDVLDAAGLYKKNNPSANVRIKLAAHTYTPTRKEIVDYGSSQVWNDDERTYSFFIPRGITLMGGYTTSFDTRNIGQNQVILSGNKLGSSSSQYMYHVTSFTQRTYTGDDKTPIWSSTEELTEGITILDGIILKHGNASGQSDNNKRGGAGIIPDYVHIRNCIVSDCLAAEQGGGLYLKPGAVVSGALITHNQAKQGGGIYVEALETGKTEPAKIINTTIINNEVTSGGRGGGLHFGRGNAYMMMCVVWGNTGNTGKNVYGVTDEIVKLTINAIKDNNGVVRTEHYPFNYSAVEAIRQPGENNILVSADNDLGVRFVNIQTPSASNYETYANPRDGSLIISAGVNNDIWLGLITQFDVATYDYRMNARWETNSLLVDVGARASSIVYFKASDPYFTRLFVTEGNYNIGNARYGMAGSSFRNPFTSLEEALTYIDLVRANNASDNVSFEIFIAGGTYYPFSAPGGYSTNLRKSAFTLPQGVQIYGGFNGQPGNTVDWDYYQPTGYTAGIDTGFDASLKPGMNITTAGALANREQTDVNQNGIYEPWEFRRQTILNGQVNSYEQALDAYHILYNDVVATTGLSAFNGADKSVVIDGLFFMNGEALHGRDAAGVDRGASYYKGGAVNIQDATTQLTIRRCMFIDNQGRMGGAVYSNAPIYIYGSLFAQNAALKEDNVTGSEGKDGYGSALFINGSAVYAVNSIFANNEADEMATIYGDAEGLYTLNCNIVRNKANQYPIFNLGGNNWNMNNVLHVNNIFWGNSATTNNNIQNGLGYSYGEGQKKYVVFSAYESGIGPLPEVDITDRDLINAASDATLKRNNNIALSSTNWSLDGPCFSNPSTVAGLSGYSPSNNWAINTQTVLLDAGWGRMQQVFDDKGNPSFDTSGHGGAYQQIASTTSTIFGIPFNANKWMPYQSDEAYMKRTNGTTMLRISTDPNIIHPNAYIDIGAYEYQQVKLVIKDLTEIDTIYVRTHENADLPADGTTWETATSDLQRAIETLLSSRNGKKKMIFMAEGEYAPTYLVDGNRGFSINNNTIATLQGDATEVWAYPINDLLIRGGYSDIELDNSRRNFAGNKTIIRAVNGRNTNFLFTIKDAKYGTGQYSINGKYYGTAYISKESFDTKIHYKHCPKDENLLYSISGKTIEDANSVIPIIFDGITFSNEYSVNEGSIFRTEHDMQGCLVMNNCEFMLGNVLQSYHDKNIPSVVVNNGIIMNSVFHSNDGPLKAENSTIMNCTFANNYGKVNLQGNSVMTNSVLWNNNIVYPNEQFIANSGLILNNNAIQNYTPSANDTNEALSSDNSNLLEGPNFVNPTKATSLWSDYDYSLSASMKLLDKGDGETTGVVEESNYDTRYTTGTGAYYDLLLNKAIDGGYEAYPPETATLEIPDVRNLLDPAYRLNDYNGKVFGELDMAFNDRLFASTTTDKRVVDRGAYEYNRQLREVLYVNNLSGTDGDGSSWDQPMRDLQSAIDLAFIRSVSSEHTYILSKHGRFEDIVARQGMTIFGSIQDTENRLAEDLMTGTDILTGIKEITNDRPGLVETGTNRTVLRSIQTNGFDVTIPTGVGSEKYFTFMDGFELTGNSAGTPTVNINANTLTAGEVTYNPFIFRNSVVWGNTNSASNSPIIYNRGGLLYNVLVHGNTVTGGTHVVSTGSGRVVNTTIDAGSTGSTLSIENGMGYNNLLCTNTDDMLLTRYLDRVYGQPNHTAYQLDETAITVIDYGISAPSSMPNTLPGINFATDRDLLGNNRLYNGNELINTATVDLGCFETIRIPANRMQEFTQTDNTYPHLGSVVYAMEGATITLEEADEANNKPGYPGMFQPAYLLLKNEAQLYGNANPVSLNYVGVEKTFATGYNLFSLPFAVKADNSGTLKEGIIDANTYSAVNGLELYTYDGAARAASLNKYHADNSPYWTKATAASTIANRGYYPSNSGEGDGMSGTATYRFTAQGNGTAAYTENGTDKVVNLTQYNLTNATGVQFTFKENMGWNLFGAPYLCRYDWTKMKNEHVVYGYDNATGYKSFYSWDLGTTGGAANWDLPLHGAYFTQTAIINGPEEVRFPTPRIGDVQTSVQTRGMALQLAADGEDAVDEVTLFASPSPSSSLEYRLGEDAVKMMSPGDLPQIYIANNGGNRFSIVTTVDTEGTTPVGVRTRKAGTYWISLSEESLADYEYVVLTDLHTNKVVDLKEEEMSFSAKADVDDASRFVLTFKAMQHDADKTIRAYDTTEGVAIEGLQRGDRIFVYDAAGRLTANEVAAAAIEYIRLERNIYIVKVVRDGMKDWTGKVAVK